MRERRPFFKAVSFLFIGVILLAAFLLGLWQTPVLAAITVPTKDYPTIQSAIDNDKVGAGETILVSDGTYEEYLYVNKSLTIRSAGGAGAASIGGIEILTGGVTIDGFTIYAYWTNTAMLVTNASNCLITNNIFPSNSNSISLKNSNSNTIKNNTCSGDRGTGISLYNSSSNTVENNTISRKYWGIYVYYYSHDNIVKGNTCSDSIGDGIIVTSPETNSLRNSLLNNTCSKNGGAGIYLGANADYSTLEDNTCSGNTVAGISVNSSHNTLRRNTCSGGTTGIGVNASNNTLEYNNLSGVSNDAIGAANATDLILRYNSCSGSDSGIALYNTRTTTLENNNCSGNKNGSKLNQCSGITMRSNNFSGNTTGIAMTSTTYSSLENNTCSNNSNDGIGMSGSGANTLKNNISSNNGRGIALYGSNSTTIENSTCSGNKTEGIFLDSSSYVTLRGNTCSGTQTGSGIVLQNNSSNSNVLESNTSNGNSSHGIYLDETSGGNLKDSTCTGNSEGGIFAVGNLTMSGSNNNISNNTLFGIYVPNGYVNISGSVKANNNGTSQDSKRYGIYAKGDIISGDIEAVANFGDGIYSDSSIQTGSVRASSNTGFGILAKGNLTINGSNNEISVNGLDGIFVPNGWVRISGTSKVNDNGTRRTSDDAGSMVGGIGAKKEIITGDIEASFNFGHGIFSIGSSIQTGSVRASNNTEIGISVPAGYLTINGGNNYISYNGRYGVYVPNGVASIAGPSKINSNKSTGVAVGSVIMNKGEISRNKGWGIDAIYNVRLQGVRIYQNRLGGIRGAPASEGYSMGLKAMRESEPDSSSISESMITANEGDGIRFESGLPITINNNNIFDNAGFEVNNLDQTSVINAQSNWWGSADSPEGENFNGTVDFSNQRATPVILIVTPGPDIAGAKGKDATATFTIGNPSDSETTYNLTISETLGWNLSPISITKLINAGSVKEIPVTVSIPLTAPEGAVDELTFTATSVSDPGITDSTTLLVTSLEPQYSLIIGMAGNGTTSPTAGTYTYPSVTVVNITATPAAGWKFVNWTGDVTEPNSAASTVTMNANKTVTANFNQITYPLTMAVSGNGTTTPVGTHDYPSGTVVDIFATRSAGRCFVNWTGEVADANSASTTVTMNANKTVTANFAQIFMGDLDGDLDINPADAVLGLKAMTGRDDYGTINLCADVNDNGKIDLADVIYILQKIVGVR